MGIKLFDNTLLERALDASWARNEVISNNIANVDTPGYKRMDVNFDEYLKAAVNKNTISGFVSNSGNVSPSDISNNDEDSSTSSLPKLKVTTDYSTTSMRMDGNNVDIDVEATELAKNQILYNAYTNLLNKNYSMLRTAIREGR